MMRSKMDELDCMRVVEEALQALSDEAARSRVASWVAAKYAIVSPTKMHGRTEEKADSRRGEISVTPGEIPGIAKLSQSGELQLTVRDFKAKSTNDAAVRLIHIVIWATTKLTGETSVSSKGVIVPLLKKYRCYDGNTRTAIARDKGLVRDGDQLSLDFHAEQFAKKVAEEILDSATEGKWKPGSAKRRDLRAKREISQEIQ